MDNSLLSFSESVFSFIVINTIFSALLAALVLSIKITWPKLPKQIEYGLWCIVLIRLVLPVDLSFGFSFPALARAWLSGVSPEYFNFASIIESALVLKNTAFFTSLTWEQLIASVWSIIVIAILGRYLWLRFLLLRLINRSSPIVEYPIVACANRWRLNFWIKQPVHVIAAEKYLSPFTFFFKSPIVFIPKKIIETNNEVLIESIIAHEMAHVKRKDSLWLIVQNVIQILYFFNPVVWLVVRRLSDLRERLCDEMVLANKTISPATYGQSLISVLRFNLTGLVESKLLNGFLGYKSQIKKRITKIGQFNESKKTNSIGLIFILSFGIFFLPFLEKAPVSISPVANHSMDEVEPLSPFPESVRQQVTLPVVHRDDE